MNKENQNNAAIQIAVANAPVAAVANAAINDAFDAAIAEGQAYLIDNALDVYIIGNDVAWFSEVN